MFPQDRLRVKKRKGLVSFPTHHISPQGRTCFQEPRLLPLVSTVQNWQHSTSFLEVDIDCWIPGEKLHPSSSPPYQYPSHFPATTYIPREGSGWELSAKVVKREILKGERAKRMPAASPCNSPSKFAADYTHTYALAVSGLVISILFYVQQLYNIQNTQPVVYRKISIYSLVHYNE